MNADPGCRAVRWALALLDGLLAGGVRLLALSPGARSTPVVLAAQRRPALELVPILDERDAAFFALGAARACQRPVAVLATSGSAPTHWYPAVVEAAAAGVPLVFLSADRPPRLRGWGANQTIDQTRLFGPFARAFFDPGPPDDRPAALKAQHALGWRAACLSQAPRPGPVHLNLPFDEPLVPTGDCPEPPTWPRAPLATVGATVVAGTLPPWPAGRGIIVCGPGVPAPGEQEALWRCAARWAVPVLTDPLSGLRFGTDEGGAPPAARIFSYDTFLRQPQVAAALRPDWVLRWGRAPVSKVLGTWLNGIPAILLGADDTWSDPSHDGAQRWQGDAHALWSALAVGPPPDTAWLARWQAVEQATAARIAAYLAEAPWCEGHLIRRLLATIPPGEALLCANSLPIRQLDIWSPARAALAVFGNRGVSGIDGQLATLAGANVMLPTWGLLGDLSFCHNLGGLLLGAYWRRPVIVINNGGGRIFDYLPQRELPDCARLWRLPVTPDLAAVAHSFGIEHIAVESDAELARALAEPPRGRLIEARIDAERSRATHLEFWRQMAL